MPVNGLFTTEWHVNEHPCCIVEQGLFCHEMFGEQDGQRHLLAKKADLVPEHESNLTYKPVK